MDRSHLPTELRLLDYDRMSELLNNPTFWSTPGTLASLLLIAKNGSILAHAYRVPRPTRVMRSDATAYSATYTAYMSTSGMNHGDSVTRVIDGQATVITAITSNILLAVTGTRLAATTSDTTKSSSSSSTSLANDHGAVDESSDFPESELEALLSITDDIISLLKSELSQMRWPEDF